MEHDNTCEMCGIRVGETKENGKPAILNAHHLIPKESFPNLRYDLRNGCCLCQYHHKFSKDSAHRGGLVFADWFKNKRPQDYAYLLKAYTTEPESLEAVLEAIEVLTVRKKELKVVDSEIKK